MRTPMAMAFALVVGCGGRETVEGPPVGACSTLNGQWSCTTFADASGGESNLPQCPANFDPGASCSIPMTTASPGFMNVYQNGPPGDCFSCTGNGLGLDWTCSSKRWQVAGVYSCK